MATKLRRSVPLPALGLDVSKPGEWIDTRATSNCENVEIRRTVILKRPGSVELGTTLGERVQALFDYDDGQSTHFIRISNTKAETYNQTTDAWASILSAPLTGSDSDRVSFAFPVLNADRIAVFTNGVDVIKKYTGTGTCSSLGGTPPIAKFLLDYGSYLLAAYIIDGGTTYFTRVQWCDTGDVESWAAGPGSDAGSVELLEDSEAITGLGRFGQYATVHKRNSIYVGYLTGTSSVFRFDRKATGAGAVANNSIQTLPTGEQVFLANDGIRLFNGVTAPLIESPIMDDLRDYMNPEQIHKSCSTIVKELDEYWIGVPIGSDEEPSTVYKYNYMSRQVYKDRRPLLVALGDYRSTTTQDWDSDPEAWDSDTTRWDQVTDLTLSPVTAFGFSDGVTTKRTTSANDDGEAIDTFWDSKDFVSSDFGVEEGRMMRWLAIQIIAKGQGVTVSYSTDGGSTWTEINTFSLSSDYPTDPGGLVGYFDVIASRCRFRFSNAVVDETFTLKQFYPEAVPREIR